ncbi:uncharacterized protein LOC135331895 isoform X2 [Halichondria panicea]|uniref:uncharacterized protein LOC135331895 isoform X2 n=1 Tax=Halichondria panicea TaxID=6063 RepID=UPI00312B932C
MTQQTTFNEAPPNYYELSVRDGTVAQQPPQQPTQQPPPTGQVYYPAQQPQVVPSTVYQMPYQIPRMYQQVEAAVGKPPYPGPSDYLILSLVTMIVCGVLNITSLMIGIPGLVFAGLSNHHRTVHKNYHNANKYSNYALGLVLANIIYTLLWGVILIGVLVGISGFGLYGFMCPSVGDCY